MIKEYALYTFKDAENCDLVCETQHNSAIQIPSIEHYLLYKLIKDVMALN